MIGKRLLHYEIVEKLGAGGMGLVYKARDTHLDRFVAIKVLPADKLADELRRARFVQEAKAASALNHPNIVHIYDISSQDKTDFIAMEHIEGKTLDQIIPRKGMRLNEALKIGAQVADALTRAHSAGIVHRDLKPSNIMVTADGLAKVLDFGLAKLTEPDVAASAEAETATIGTDARVHTQDGAIVGTAAYMSPEQAEGRTADPRSDIFSFGAVLYEMVTGSRAFAGDSQISTLSAVLNKDPAAMPEDVPRDVEKVIVRCLRKDPDRRFQMMKDLKVELDELREESASGNLSRPLPRANAGPRRVRPLLFAAALTACVLTLAFVVWLRWSSTKDTAASLPLSPPLPVTTYPGAEERVTISPDGGQVAFSGNVEQTENFDIYVKLIGSEPPLRLTRDPDPDSWPEWSPDGRWIAFIRNYKKLLLVSPLGGPERLVAEGDLMRCTWSADGQNLFVESLPGLKEGRTLSVISIVTGQRKELVRDAGMPSVSHAGHELAYVRYAGHQRLFVAPLSKRLELGEPRLIETVKPAALLGCAWTEGDRELVCALRQQAGNPTTLWRIPVQSSLPPQVLPFTEGAADPAISVAARRLVFDRFKSDTNIWRAPNPAHGGSASTVAARFISSTQQDLSPQYSPDGGRIAFLSLRSGQMEIWVAREDSSELRMLTSQGRAGVPQWSPDGKSIVFARDGEVYTVDSQGGVPRLVSADPADKAIMPSYSRDGRSIYFACNRSGKLQVCRMPAAGGKVVQLTSDGGTMPIESVDGHFLFYLNSDREESSLWRMPTSGGPQQRLASQTRFGSQKALQFALASRGLYCIRYDRLDRPTGIDFVDLRTGAISRALTIDMPQRFSGSGLSVSPDGRWFLYVLYDFEDDLMQFENFR